MFSINPLNQSPISPPIPLVNWAIFTMLEAWGEELKMFFELHKQRNNMWGFKGVLKCLLTDLSTLCTWKPSWSLWSCSLSSECQYMPPAMYLWPQFIKAVGVQSAAFECPLMGWGCTT
jgi:hypothetical protein